MTFQTNHALVEAAENAIALQAEPQLPKLYKVAMEEIQTVTIEIAADSPEDALKRVGKGQGEILSTSWKSRLPETARIV